MTRVFVVVLSLAVMAGCASFSGPGVKSDLVAPPKVNYAYDISGRSEPVSVRMHRGYQSSYCWRDASGIDCNFWYDRANDDLRIFGYGWEGLDSRSAAELCRKAFFTMGIGDPLNPTVQREHVEACAYGLLELRYQELAPGPYRDPRTQ